MCRAHPRPPTQGPRHRIQRSTAWDAVVRSRIWFKRIKDAEGNDCDDRYSLELVKSNYAKRFGIEIALTALALPNTFATLRVELSAEDQ